jgi:hypothetical protein
MSKQIINKSIVQNINSKLLNWHCEPKKYEILGGSLIVETGADTDFWQKTHYGFEADNGHFLFCEVEGDFVIETSVKYSFKNQYDQAGLMIRVSPECWIKTAIEYEPAEPNKLGAVVTNGGYSDWSTQDIADDLTELSFRIERKNSDYTIYYRELEKEEWIQLRLTHLEDTPTVKCGIYACSPKKKGFKAKFDSLLIYKEL